MLHDITAVIFDSIDVVASDPESYLYVAGILASKLRLMHDEKNYTSFCRVWSPIDTLASSAI